MASRALILAVSALAAATATPASALQIILNDIGGVRGTPAAAGFSLAARYWESVITTPVTIRFDVGFSDLGPGVLGATTPVYNFAAIEGVQSRIVATGSNSAIDRQVRASGLAPLTPGGVDGFDKAAVVMPGYVDPAAGLGVDATTARLNDAPGLVSNSILGLTQANAKALGIADPAGAADATIRFSSRFAFDFNPKNGITPGTSDFVGVAIHELGHALGFVSGTDFFDVAGCPAGPACFAVSTERVDDFVWGLTFDLFRYSRAFDGSARLDWRPGVPAYFSVNGGASELYRRGDLATGVFSGTLNPIENFTEQASHWLAPQVEPLCSGFIGIMNSYLCGGVGGIVTGSDLAVFDAIGWNLTAAARRPGPGYRADTRDIAALLGVPEPQTWAMMIAGFGLVGWAVRRRAAGAHAPGCAPGCPPVPRPGS